MHNRSAITALIAHALSTSRLAVLATEGAGQPHASLVAITPTGQLRQLVFATYSGTRKYTNLAANTRVALLMRVPDVAADAGPGPLALTATGRAREARGAQRDLLLGAHLRHHPDLAAFLQAPACAVFCVEVESYQVARGIDDVASWPIDALEGS